MLRNKVTGSVVRVDDATAARLAGDPVTWEPYEAASVELPPEPDASTPDSAAEPGAADVEPDASTPDPDPEDEDNAPDEGEAGSPVEPEVEAEPEPEPEPEVEIEEPKPAPAPRPRQPRSTK